MQRWFGGGGHGGSGGRVGSGGHGGCLWGRVLAFFLFGFLDYGAIRSVPLFRRPTSSPPLRP